MEILNEIQGKAITEASSPLFFIFFILFIIFFIGFLVEVGSLYGSEVAAGFLFVLSFIFFIAMLAVSSSKTGEYKPTRYEVRLTDKSFVIDASKYKIIEKRGEIYVLEEVQEELAK